MSDYLDEGAGRPAPSRRPRDLDPDDPEWRNPYTRETLREHVARIVGCLTEAGACVVHQPRPWEPRRRGCPFVDSIVGPERGTSC